MPQLIIVALLALLSSCGPSIVINSGPSDPDRHHDSLSMVRERTSIIGYEFGLCDSDDDCAPRACGGSVCSPNQAPAVCVNDEVAACLSRVPEGACGCNDGVCRWARSPQVMACSTLTLPENIHRPLEGGQDGAYPRRHP